MTQRLPTSLLSGVASARLRALVIEKTGLEVVDRALQRLQDALRPVFASTRFDQSTIRDVVFAAGVPQAVGHRLGRAYQGWSIARIRTNGATFYEQANSSSALDTAQVTLVASANCTADVEVW